MQMTRLLSPLKARSIPQALDGGPLQRTDTTLLAAAVIFVATSEI